MEHAESVIKKLTAIILTAAAVIALFGCGGGAAKESVAPGTVIENNDEHVTIVDQAGRAVTVDKGVESIAFSYRVIARFIISLGEGDKITGSGKSEPFLYELEPGLWDAVDVGKGVPDLEAIASLEPDVYFYRSTDVEGLENVAELGIPSIGLSFEDPEEMKTALSIMGAVLEKEDRAAELIAYYDAKIEADKAQADEIEDKKTAIVMGSSIGKVADGTMLQSAMIEYAGGINPASDIEATELWPTAGTEQIFSWDPDFIFITGNESTNYTVDDIINDPAWAELKAVKNKNVYQMPAAVDSWEFPGIVSAIGIDYIKSKMYPELLSEEELQKNIDEFYELSYGRRFSGEEIGY